MNTTSFYPVVAVTDVTRSAAFFRDWFDFETTFAADWYVSMVDRDGRELAVLDAQHPTIPAGHRAPAQGVLLNFEVADVDAEWRRLVADGHLEAALPLRTEDFGQRHFIVAGPDKILIDVITVIPPSDEYAEQYAGQATPED